MTRITEALLLKRKIAETPINTSDNGSGSANITYGVVYRFHDVTKSVRLGIDTMFRSESSDADNISGSLQIEKIANGVTLNTLKFVGGIPSTYVISSSDHTTIYDKFSSTDSGKQLLEDTLKKFGNEFKLIFENNPKLKDAPPVHFAALMPYL